jgi:hypothetical protein
MLANIPRGPQGNAKDGQSEEERAPMTITEIQKRHWESKQNELDQLLRHKANLEKEAQRGAPKEVLEARLIGLNRKILAARTVIRAYKSQSMIP